MTSAEQACTLEQPFQPVQIGAVNFAVRIHEPFRHKVIGTNRKYSYTVSFRVVPDCFNPLVSCDWIDSWRFGIIDPFDTMEARLASPGKLIAPVQRKMLNPAVDGRG